jgi:hypothetical protein
MLKIGLYRWSELASRGPERGMGRVPFKSRSLIRDASTTTTSPYVILITAVSLGLSAACNQGRCDDSAYYMDNIIDWYEVPVEADDESIPQEDYLETLLSDLEPITAGEAERLGAYARKLKCASQGNDSRPVAWSMVNDFSTYRTLALAYALANADPELSGVPPTMVDRELTLDRISAFAQHPSFDVAIIDVAGPLVTFQSLRTPDGKTINNQPLQYYWAYNHGVVVNVEGEPRVFDLSISNAPQPVGDWLDGFVDPSVTCRFSNDELLREVWLYWNSAFSNLELPNPPPVMCAYTITPIFSFKRAQIPSVLADFVAAVPFAMDALTRLFETMLYALYGVAIAQDELSTVTSQYRPGTIRDVCNWSRMKFCDQI